MSLLIVAEHLLPTGQWPRTE